MYSRNDNKAKKKGQQSPHSWWMAVQGKAQFLIHVFLLLNVTSGQITVHVHESVITD
jgi:hypothetical protein